MLDDSALTFKFAHDVRAHLRTVLTRIQLVQNSTTAVLSPEAQALLQEAANGAREIEGLLSAAVAYCEAPAEGAENLRLLLRGVLLERKAALSESGAEVLVSNELETRVPAALKSVLKELLINACRFRSNDRPLRMAIASRMAPGLDPAVEITVTDNGIGVDPAWLEKIFAPFTRLHPRDNYPGHGLGLATCRRLVFRCGGTISAEGAPEHGLTVRVTLPVETN